MRAGVGVAFTALLLQPTAFYAESGQEAVKRLFSSTLEGGNDLQATAAERLFMNSGPFVLCAVCVMVASSPVSRSLKRRTGISAGSSTHLGFLLERRLLQRSAAAVGGLGRPLALMTLALVPVWWLGSLALRAAAAAAAAEDGEGYGGGGGTKVWREESAKALGSVSVVLLALALLPVARRSFVLKALGVSFEASIFLHRFASRGMVVLGALHGLAFSSLWALLPEAYGSLRVNLVPPSASSSSTTSSSTTSSSAGEDTDNGLRAYRAWRNVLGVAAAAAGLGLLALSRGTVRRRSFALFRAGHRALVPLTIAGTCLHWAGAIWFLLPPLAVYVSDATVLAVDLLFGGGGSLLEGGGRRVKVLACAALPGDVAVLTLAREPPPPPSPPLPRAAAAAAAAAASTKKMRTKKPSSTSSSSSSRGRFTLLSNDDDNAADPTDYGACDGPDDALSSPPSPFSSSSSSSSSSCCSSGFTPGQWVLLGVPSLAGSSLWDVHPFSVTSSCTADPESFTVHVKASGSGTWTRKLLNACAACQKEQERNPLASSGDPPSAASASFAAAFGSGVRVAGWFGGSLLPDIDASSHVLLIAGGIGITPFLSLVSELEAVATSRCGSSSSEGEFYAASTTSSMRLIWVARDEKLFSARLLEPLLQASSTTDVATTTTTTLAETPALAAATGGERVAVEAEISLEEGRGARAGGSVLRERRPILESIDLFCTASKRGAPASANDALRATAGDVELAPATSRAGAVSIEAASTTATAVAATSAAMAAAAKAAGTTAIRSPGRFRPSCGPDRLHAFAALLGLVLSSLALWAAAGTAAAAAAAPHHPPLVQEKGQEGGGGGIEGAGKGAAAAAAADSTVYGAASSWWWQYRLLQLVLGTAAAALGALVVVLPVRGPPSGGAGENKQAASAAAAQRPSSSRSSSAFSPDAPVVAVASAGDEDVVSIPSAAAAAVPLLPRVEHGRPDIASALESLARRCARDAARGNGNNGGDGSGSTAAAASGHASGAKATVLVSGPSSLANATRTCVSERQLPIRVVQVNFNL
jgi:hypothetical protein